MLQLFAAHGEGTAISLHAIVQTCLVPAADVAGEVISDDIKWLAAAAVYVRDETF